MNQSMIRDLGSAQIAHQAVLIHEGNQTSYICIRYLTFIYLFKLILQPRWLSRQNQTRIIMKTNNGKQEN
jgi:hypothetical protein